MHFLPFSRARLQQLATLCVLSVLAAVGGLGCPDGSAKLNGTAISGTEFAYVANSGDNSVSVYSVDANAGKLTSIGTAQAGKSPIRIVSASLSPTQNFVYVLNSQDSTISQFAVNKNGSLSALSPATVSVGATPLDMAFGTNGLFFFSTENFSRDERDFRIYVTTAASDLKTFQIKADGTLALAGQLQGLNSPSAVTVGGPTYSVYSSTGSLIPAYEGNTSVLVANQTANTVTQLDVAPLAQGGLKYHAPPTLPTGQSPVALAATSGTLAVCNGQEHTVLFRDLADELQNHTVDVGANPIAVTSAALYQLDSLGRNIKPLEPVYVATSAGAIYQLTDLGSNLHGISDNIPVPPVQLTPQPLALKGYRGRLYVVKQSENMVTSYALLNQGSGTGFGTAVFFKNGSIQTDSAQSTATGHAPAAIAFLNTSANAGSAQTTIR